MRRLTWRVFVLYIINPTLEGSGNNCILDFHNGSLGWKSLMDSCNFILNMLVFYRGPFRNIRMFMLRGLDWGVPSLYYFLKIS